MDALDLIEISPNNHIEQFKLAKQITPHLVLGLHDEAAHRVIRLWRPDAKECHIVLKGQTKLVPQVDGGGFFELEVPKNISARDYQVYHSCGLLAYDPYNFTTTFSEMDEYLFGKGVHYELHYKMGGRIAEQEGVMGAKFAVWAPNAKSVSLVGDFNSWDGRTNPMRSLGHSGVWEIFVPGLEAGEKYKFEIFTHQGHTLLKADPYALQSELRPQTASILKKIDNFTWNDENFLQLKKEKSHLHSPMSIYEVHSGSWNQFSGQFLGYKDMAHNLASYCKHMGFTHVELMPIQEHPLDESWGYQVSGFFAPTSRHGSLEDFKYFVNHLHQEGVGVILDWVPGHFPTDNFSLANFDGSALYEHADPRQGYHPHWHTNIFNFGRHEVSNFLIANAIFWLETMHIDGLRVDAVASMLYADYGREEGAWIANIYGGRENLSAIEFLKHLNSIVHQKIPGAIMIAEESTSFPGVTTPVNMGGLGFDFKWNMGWMNDTLRYFALDPVYRAHHHHDLTFGLIYAFSENFIYSLSHDEVVHGKRSLLDKMPGDIWQKFANLKLLLSYLVCQPGKNLIFMGAELGQWNEWNCKKELDWLLLDFPDHAAVQRMVKELNHLYLQREAFWAKDGDYKSFEWLQFQDSNNSVIAYMRHGVNSSVLCVHNFTPQYIPNYFFWSHRINKLNEIFNTDEQKYGGSGKVFSPAEVKYDANGQIIGIEIALAPLATMIFEVELIT